LSVITLPARGFRQVHEAVREANDRAGEDLAAQHKFLAAIAMTKRAIAYTPNSRELWSNLATYFWNVHEFDEAMACVERSIAIDPLYSKSQFNKALILESMQRFDEAEKQFDLALELEPHWDNIKWCRSLLHLGQGDYTRGFEEYEYRIKCRVQNKRLVYPKFPSPLWQGENLYGKTIYVASEQGIGDTIMFHRWMPWLEDQVGGSGRIYFCPGPATLPLLWDMRGKIIEFVPDGVPIPKSDYSLVMGSLPWHSRATLETLPPDPGFIRSAAETQMRIGPVEMPEPDGPSPFKIGICWTGNPDQERNRERSIPFEHILDLTAHPNVWAYSLQVGPGEKDIEKFGAQGLVHNLGPQLGARGLTVTATAIMKMDLVITCCTSIAHLCGALGVPCWIVLCAYPYWVWMTDREDTPWYPNTRLFRQEKFSDGWKPVMNKVCTELNQHIENFYRSGIQTNK
jgi:hypothetical protein